MKKIFILKILILFWVGSLAQSKAAREYLRNNALIPYRDGNIWGYANGNLDIMIEPKFDKVGFFHSNTVLYTFVKKKKFFFIDRKGKRVNNNKYSYIKHWSFDDFLVEKNGKETHLNDKLVEGQKSFYCGGSINIAIYFNKFKKNDLIGLTSTEKFISSEAIWNEVKPNGNGTCAVRKDSLWAIIDKNLNFTSDYFYDEVKTIDDYKYYFYYVKKNNKWGVLNSSGKVLIEPKFYRIEPYNTFGLAKVWINEKYWFYVDGKGLEYYNKNSIIE